MEHDQRFHALLLLGLLWLGMLLDWGWRQGRPALCQTLPRPATPIKTHSKDPKPFQGPIHQPLWEACVHTAAPRGAARAWQGGRNARGGGSITIMKALHRVLAL